MGHFKMTRPQRAGKSSIAEEWVAAHEAAGHEVTRVTVYADDDFEAPTVEEIMAARPVDRMLTVESILPPEALPKHVASQPIEVTRELPTRPYDQLLWRAYVTGAEWGGDEEYPAWDDRTFYEGQLHGQLMLERFYDLLEEMRPKQVVAQTLCSLGRPLRDHAARCHPECEWRAP